MSELLGRREAEPVPYRLAQIALLPSDRAALHRRIAGRFRAMLEAGFLDEVRALKARGDLHPDLPSIRSVGYRQAWDYLDGQISRDGMIERAVAATRQLAKRQLTWLRSWPDLEILPAGHPEPDKLLEAALKLVETAAI
mgnify:CR=1 FL=1